MNNIEIMSPSAILEQWDREYDLSNYGSFLNRENILEFQLVDFLSEESITEAKEQYTDKMKKEFEKVLERNKVKDPDAYKKAAKKLKEQFGFDLIGVGGDIAKFAFSKLTKDGFSKEARKEIENYADKKFTEMAKSVKTVGDDYVRATSTNKEYQKYLNDDKAFSKRKLTAAYNLLFRVLITNTIIHELLKLVFGPIGVSIWAVVCAPIVEENSKIAAVKGDFIVEYNLVFNAYEFTYYTITYGPAVGVANIVKIRLAVIGMHTTTAIVHWLADNPLLNKINKANKLEVGDNNKHTIVGQFIGTAIHMAWNANSEAIVKIILK